MFLCVGGTEKAGETFLLSPKSFTTEAILTFFQLSFTSTCLFVLHSPLPYFVDQPRVPLSFDTSLDIQFRHLEEANLIDHCLTNT